MGWYQVCEIHFSWTQNKDIQDFTLGWKFLYYPGRQVTSSCEIASKRIQGLLEAYFKINKSKTVVSKKTIPLFVWR